MAWMRNPELKPYEQQKHEVDDCTLWGCHVVVPLPCRTPVVKMLLKENSGISKMKALATNVAWWPGLDTEQENMVKLCAAC